MLTAIALLLIAYLLGSLSGSLLLGRLRGVDIRTQGSGNAGGTNALRTQGWKFALGTVVVDVGKGAAATGLATVFAPPSQRDWLVPACVLVAVAAHVWPVFHGFRGGKGAATLVGGLLVYWPLAVPVLVAVWALVLMSSGYVGLSTVLAGVSIAVLAFVAGSAPPRLLFSVAAALFIVFTHRGNLSRLRRGVEPCFERARVFARPRKSA
jgi:acyl phosphate:glycerol-3-phosphate acyltransferase